MKCAIILLVLTYVWAAPVDDALQEFVEGNHVFTAAIYKEVVKQNKGNLIVSPFSVEAILALTYEGARGATAAELVTGLSLPSTKEKTEEAYQAFIPKLRSSSNDLKISVANKIFVENEVELEESFRSVAVDVYGSGVENVDFEDKVHAAAEINEWVEEQTNHKIQNLISPDAINGKTELILVNALYLSGKWATPFGNYPVVPQKFYTTKDDSVLTDTLHNQAVYNYYANENLDAKFLEMPLAGGEVSLVIILPNEIDGVDSLEEKIDQVLAPQPFSRQDVVLDLPKFKIESQTKFVPVLETLGVHRLFNPATSDLTGISSNVKDLFVSDIVQKAYISITQGGIEAAAATVVVVRPSSIPVVPIPPIVFRVDHPFLYYVKDNGAILFSGRYVEPTVSQ